MSSAQRRLFLQCQWPGGDRAYHLLYLARVRGRFPLAAAQAFADRMLTRHESLRTGFRVADGEFIAEVHAAVGLSILVADANERDLDAIVERYDTPFDLAVPPLLRVVVLRLDVSECIVMLNFHHLVFDGTSAAILGRDLLDALSGRHAAPPASTYADFVEWERAFLDSPAYARAREFWCRQYERAPLRVAFAPDFPPPATRTFAGGYIMRHVESRPLKAFCASHDCTLFTCLLAAFYCVLHKLTGQDEITLGTLFSQRESGQFHDVIGLFANTLPLTLRVDAEATFSTCLERVQAQVYLALQHADFPYEHLVRALPFREKGARNPLFDVVFNFERAAGRRVETFGEVTVEPVDFHAPVSMFDFAIDVVEYEDEIQFKLEYSTALFRAETMQGLMEAYVAILKQVCDGPLSANVSIRALSLLTEDSQARLLAWNDTTRALPAGRTVLDAWRQAAAAYAENPAVRQQGREVSYAQVEARSNRLAHRLRALNLASGAVVALALDKSVDWIVSLLAVWKAGLVYLPMSADLPTERIRYCLADSAAALVIAPPAFGGLSSVPVLHVASAIPSDDAAGDVEPGAHVEADRIAYIIYTSGSTGTPKGVLVDHRALHAHVEAARAVYRLRADDNVLQFSSPMFDASIEQILVTLTAGACLVLPESPLMDPDALLRLLSAEEITVAEFPPAYLQELVPRLNPRSLARLRCLLSGGDILTAALARELKRFLPARARLLNFYGPSEAAMAATMYAVPGGAGLPDVLDDYDSWVSLPIGKPLQNTRTYVIEGSGELLPIGVAGELCIAGERLAAAYLNQPALTAERFVELDLLGRRERVYRTGDRVRLLADGNLEFLGRLDRQVQLRGYRIELGEIEHGLLRHPAIRDAIVVLFKEGGDSLAALVALHPGAEAAPSELREWLATFLPDYMIPSRVNLVDEIPRDAKGVAERLRQPAAGDVGGRPAQAGDSPLDSVEWDLLQMWRTLLDVKDLGRNDVFFELGGNSLHALQLMARVRNRYGVDLPLSIVLRRMTVASLAAFLRGAEKSAAPSCVVPLQSQRSGPPVILVPGLGGNLLDLFALSSHLGRRCACYGLQHPWGAEFEDGDQSIEALGARYLGELEGTIDLDDCVLVGHSFGAYVAYDMALRLQSRPRPPQSLVVLDVAAPGESRFDPTEREMLDITVQTLLGEDDSTGSQRVASSPREEAGVPGTDACETALEMLRAANRLPDMSIERFRRLISALGTRARAFSHYVPAQAISADIHLFRARAASPSNAFAQPDGRWGRFTNGNLLLHWASGTHFSMIKGEAAAELAEQIWRAMGTAAAR